MWNIVLFSAVMRSPIVSFTMESSHGIAEMMCSELMAAAYAGFPGQVFYRKWEHQPSL